MSQATREEKCPECEQKMAREFSATPSVWKTTGAYGKSK